MYILDFYFGEQSSYFWNDPQSITFFIDGELLEYVEMKQTLKHAVKSHNSCIQKITIDFTSVTSIVTELFGYIMVAVIPNMHFKSL